VARAHLREGWLLGRSTSTAFDSLGKGQWMVGSPLWPSAAESIHRLPLGAGSKGHRCGHTESVEIALSAERLWLGRRGQRGALLWGQVDWDLARISSGRARQLSCGRGSGRVPQETRRWRGDGGNGGDRTRRASAARECSKWDRLGRCGSTPLRSGGPYYHAQSPDIRPDGRALGARFCT